MHLNSGDVMKGVDMKEHMFFLVVLLILIGLAYITYLADPTVIQNVQPSYVPMW